jgi:hypothetical protein
VRWFLLTIDLANPNQKLFASPIKWIILGTWGLKFMRVVYFVD